MKNQYKYTYFPIDPFPNITSSTLNSKFSGNTLMHVAICLSDNLVGKHMQIYIYGFQFIGPVGRVFANSLGDHGSVPGRVIPKILKNGT